MLRFFSRQQVDRYENKNRLNFYGPTDRNNITELRFSSSNPRRRTKKRPHISLQLRRAQTEGHCIHNNFNR